MSKGVQYEDEVALLVDKELKDGNLGISPSLAMIRKKPSYFSRDRNANITFDVSIEVSRNGSSYPYWIWIWECKNYSHKVPVDDAEEFHAKLQQIGADKTKGTMITPIGYDRGVIEFAKSKGLGLWRYIPSGQPVCLMEDESYPDDLDVIKGLTCENTTDFRYFSSFLALTTHGEYTIDEIGTIRDEFRDV